MGITHLVLGLTPFTKLAYFVVFNTLLFGIVLAALGLIALYIGNIHTEVSGRPLYIIQERVGIVESNLL
jgi:dolichol-phosphate mannosyltransferase